MPTGYTSGILDGKTPSFQLFAKSCARAFGTMIHMRDDDSSAEYTKREPTDYHTKELDEVQKEYDSIINGTDEFILSLAKKNLKRKIKSYTSIIKEHTQNKEKLLPFLEKAKAYIPPTINHEDIKRFMIEQIETTITHDGSTKYYENERNKLKKELSLLTVKQAKIKLITKLTWSIEYHTKERDDEIQRCEESNKWVEDFYNSLT